MKTKRQIKSAVLPTCNNRLTAVVKVGKVLSVIPLLLLMVIISMAGNLNHRTKVALAGPTVENAKAAEQELGAALLANDADAVGRLLDDDWAVVNTDGGMGDGIRTGFLAAIKSGSFSRKTMVLSEFRVRLYGNIALVTTHLASSGIINGKSFDVQERQTDVLIWRKGAWKSVLTHETRIKE